MSIDLTGKWTCKQDGGTYFLRMIPNDYNQNLLIWYGNGSYKDEHGIKHTWANIAKGNVLENTYRGEEYVTIAMYWADVPSGNNRANGHLNLKLHKDKTGALSLVKVENGSSPYWGDILVKAPTSK